ncbi:MAG: hypothetical protein A2X93_07780 [Deltaproteobacteria bacterium GWC2_56_8]|nr:MAG: hypothetical protein A2X99_06190 [Deltaproteobacteria bacterium GWB2_55_19]OGP37624.1 MAG: hypothetical protein A2X93_07780 [Deltaproteobacteria bacterium GWC2_56_8]HAO92744.1 hypothetical protein [Deltaproteobacteria bacterium]
MRNKDWIILAVIIAAAFLLRLKVMDIPFERDEGEYAYAAQLMLDGVPPFREAYNMKFPGIYAVYAAILFIFGQTDWGVRLALALVNAWTIVLVYLIGRRLFDGSAGLAAGASFAMLSFLPSVHGIIANAEHFVLVFALSGALLAMKSLEDGGLWKLFAGGALLGAGYTIKQHGAAFILFSFFMVALYNLRNGSDLKRTARDISVLALGAITPFMAMCGTLYLAGVFDGFWFWTFAYAREYVSVVPFEAGLKALKAEGGRIFLSAPLIWALCLIGTVAPVWDRGLRRGWPFLLGLLAFSALAVLPGFFFRPHYFIYLLPPASLFFGAAIRSLNTFLNGNKRAVAKAGLVVALAVYFIFSQRTALASAPEALSRSMYGYNPFPESRVIAEYVARNTRPGDRVAILGSEPQILFYSRRRSATGYIYAYPLMERQRFAPMMQREMMEEIRRAGPKVVVFVDLKFSWGANPGSVLDIFGWLKEFVAEGYTLNGMVDLLAVPVKYSWGDDISGAPTPESGYGIYIYRKNAPATPEEGS